MFEFSITQAHLLPLIWGFIIALAIFMYVFLDGFDLGPETLSPPTITPKITP